jgi:hypothetical protein
MKSFDYEPIQPETPSLPEALALEVTAEKIDIEFVYEPPLPTQSYFLFAYIYKKVGECVYKMLTYKMDYIRATTEEATAQAQREFDSLARWQYKRVCLLDSFSETANTIFIQETI